MSLPFEGRCSIQLSYGRADAFCNLITELASWDFESEQARHGGLLPTLFIRLVGNFFEGEVIRAWTKDADGQDNHQHACGDEGEHAFGAKIFKEEGDHETGEYRGQAAPRIDKADGACADSRGKQLSLVSVKRIGKEIVRKRDHHSQANQPRGCGLPRKKQTK